MRLTRKWKDSGSGPDGCPALYDADNGGYVVQGKTLPPEARQWLLDLADDETAVWVPANLLDRLRGESS